MNKYKIYKLIHPITKEIKYIGVTTRSFNERLSQHMSEAKKSSTNTYKINWIKSLIKFNLKPEIHLIEECLEDNWEEREKYWISFYPNLTNTDKGGKGIVFKERIKTSNSNKKPVYKIDVYTNKILKEYSSIKEASLNEKISRTNIGNVLKKRAITAGGYNWVYKQDYDPSVKVIIKNKKSLFGKNFKNKKIEFIDKKNNSIFFESVKECALFFNYSQSYISLILNGSRKFKYGSLRYSLI